MDNGSNPHWEWLDRLAADGGRMWEEAREQERQEQAYRGRMRDEGMLNLRQVLHLLQGGAPSRDPGFDPSRRSMPAAMPEMRRGMLNGGMVRRPGSVRPRTPSIGVRG